MKVLIVTHTEENADNLFVAILCKALQKQEIDVHCSTIDFWTDNQTFYDIIHFQWPEEVVGWNGITKEKVHQLKERISYFHAQGSKIVYTRHNAVPHYSDPLMKEAYSIIESHSDTIVHMGQYSLNSLKNNSNGQKHIVIPHHIYQHTYNESLPQTEARKLLGISPNQVVITAFGKFRNREEIMMVLHGFRKFKCKHKLLLAPRLLPFSKNPEHTSVLKKVISKTGYLLMPTLLKFFNIKAGMSDTIVSQNDLSSYIAASDIILIQRKQILNSGNVPLAFLFRKIVVGPNVGNVGEWLNETGNPTFNPQDTNSLAKALNQSIDPETNYKLGEANYQYALKEMNLKKVAELYIKAYQES